LKIALDAMGSDNAPRTELEGALLALDKDPDLELVLVGKEEILRGVQQDFPKGRVQVVPAPDVVGMHESPAETLRRKPNCSIARTVALVKDGRADAAVSAGNTGAVMAFALTTLGTIPQVQRPALGAFFPTTRGSCLILDVGANIDVRPQHLFQFGMMGAVAASYILKKANPSVALVNIGHEETKGTDATRQAFALFKASELNFIGNIEGSQVFAGIADVIVCDGFVGNVMLKLTEGLGETMAKLIAEYLSSESEYRVRRWFSKPVLREFLGRVNYEEQGGALLLGINGAVVIGHGRSSPNAIKSAIEQAAFSARENTAGHIRDRFARLQETAVG
jgi:glycerol-3-phosphate acyltransferase PlsX